MLSMHTTLEEEQTVVKRALYDGMRDAKVKQEIVAKVLGLNQSSVSRMTNPNEELQLSVAHLLLLVKDPFTQPVAEAVIAALGAMFLTPDPTADGSLMDELLDLTKADGRLAGIVSDGIEKHEVKEVRALAANLRTISDRLYAEVMEAMKEENKI